MADAENHILIVDDEPALAEILVMKSIEAGCNDFILKPFQFDLLFSKVEKIVESCYQGASSKKSTETTH